MVFEKGSRNSVLKAANTICSNKQTGVQEQLSDDIQPYFPLKHQLLTAEKSMALKAARIKLMGNAAHFSQLPSSFASFITHSLSSSSSSLAPLLLGSASRTNFHRWQGKRLITVHISFVKGPQGEEEGEESFLLALPLKQFVFVSVEMSMMTASWCLRSSSPINLTSATVRTHHHLYAPLIFIRMTCLFDRNLCLQRQQMLYHLWKKLLKHFQWTLCMLIMSLSCALIVLSMQSLGHLLTPVQEHGWQHTCL